MKEPIKAWPRPRLWALCEEFGLDPKDVARIDIRGGNVQVTLYRVDENGRRYVGRRDEAATVTWDIPIRDKRDRIDEVGEFDGNCNNPQAAVKST